jgi:hypothetical protein
VGRERGEYRSGQTVLSERSLACGSFQPDNKAVIRLADWQGSQLN